MDIKTYGMDDLEAARKLQREAVRLRLPCPPVVSWEAKVVDADGVVSDHRMGKCNSYTRNGLNLIAKNAFPMQASVFSVSAFADGVISIVPFNEPSQKWSTSGVGMVYNSTSGYLRFGTGTAETLDDITVAAALTEASIGIATTFDASSRTLISVVTGVGTNAVSSTINVTEIGLLQYVFYGSSGQSLFLTVHDIVDAIPVPVGKALNWDYRFELAYQNP